MFYINAIYGVHWKVIIISINTNILIIVRKTVLDIDRIYRIWPMPRTTCDSTRRCSIVIVITGANVEVILDASIVMLYVFWCKSKDLSGDLDLPSRCATETPRWVWPRRSSAAGWLHWAGSWRGLCVPRASCCGKGCSLPFYCNCTTFFGLSFFWLLSFTVCVCACVCVCDTKSKTFFCPAKFFFGFGFVLFVFALN